MSLHPCQECGTEINSWVISCPKCGSPGFFAARPTTTVEFLLIGLAVIVFIGCVIVVRNINTPVGPSLEYQEQTSTRAIDLPGLFEGDEEFARYMESYRALRQPRQPNHGQRSSEAKAIVTLREYDQLSQGLSLEKVEQILGRSADVPPGAFSTGASKTYRWDNIDGSQVILSFENGLLATKQHSGLD